MSTRVTPTFLLKGIDPNRILQDYKNGFFNRKTETKAQLKLANTIIIAPTYGSNNHSPIYSIKDKHNCNVVIATTGHSDYQLFHSNGGKLREGGLCEHCKMQFDQTSIGYPIGYQESLLLTSDDQPRYRVFHTFWVEGTFCSFECALGYVRIMLNKPADYRDTNIRDSERLLKLLYRLMHQSSDVLRPAQDPRLLKSNGGSLTAEEWQDKKHIYTRTDRILMIPAKVEYIQENFNTPVSIISPKTNNLEL